MFLEPASWSVSGMMGAYRTWKQAQMGLKLPVNLMRSDRDGRGTVSLSLSSNCISVFLLVTMGLTAGSFWGLPAGFLLPSIPRQADKGPLLMLMGRVPHWSLHDVTAAELLNLLSQAALPLSHTQVIMITGPIGVLNYSGKKMDTTSKKWAGHGGAHLLSWQWGQENPKF